MCSIVLFVVLAMLRLYKFYSVWERSFGYSVKECFRTCLDFLKVFARQVGTENLDCLLDARQLCTHNLEIGTEREAHVF